MPLRVGPERAELFGAASGGDRFRPVWQFDVRDEIAVSQAIPGNPAADQLLHVDGVHGVRAPVVAVIELVEIVLHVLPADLGEYLLVARAHPCPERLDPVHMGHATDIMAGRVVDRLPAVVEVPVGHVQVRHDDVIGMGDVLDEVLRTCLTPWFGTTFAARCPLARFPAPMTTALSSAVPRIPFLSGWHRFVSEPPR